MLQAEIGILGGSGFYKLLDNLQEIDIDTEYGKPSDKIFFGEYAGRKIAFLPRHGREHSIPPHKINYRANIAAFKKLGAKIIISPCAAGSLQANIKPGDFVILDQFVDRTRSREDTFFEGPEIKHTAMADPYCKFLRGAAFEVCKKLEINCHPEGTVVVIQGPRFSTKAESRWFSSQGFEVVNMTQYPEVALAQELGICFLGLALVTDYDVGLEEREDIAPVSHEEVLKVFNQNIDKVKKVIFELIKNIPKEYSCNCRV